MEQKKILLVDDIGLFIAMEKEYLRRENCVLLSARSAKEALENTRAEKPDLIFMDLYMPDGDGDEACQAIKSDPELHHIPVVMVTNSQDEQDQERCQKAGCDDYINKPIDRNIFLTTAYRFLKIADEDIRRRKVKVEVLYGPDQDQMVQRRSIDLSPGGMFIETDRMLRRDTEIYLEFTLPGAGEPIHCRGRVAWANHKNWLHKEDAPPGLAVQFVDMPQSSQEMIRHFLRTSPS